MTKLILPTPPSSNRYWRLAQGRLIVSREATAYRQTVKILAGLAHVELIEGPVAVTITIFRERKSGDLDNKIKILLDALQGVYYQNDNQIRQLHACMDNDKNNPHCEVSVIALPLDCGCQTP